MHEYLYEKLIIVLIINDLSELFYDIHPLDTLPKFYQAERAFTNELKFLSNLTALLFSSLSSG